MDRAEPSNRPAVGVIGVGHMGLAMALRLLECGYPVHVHDLDGARERLAARHGATVHANPESVAQASAALIVAVVDGVQTRRVLWGERGAAPALAPGSAVLLCPTLSPRDVETVAVALSTQGVDCVDAPMSGGPLRARDGTMSLMVACPDLVFERWQGLLRDLSSRLFRVGPVPGDGARTKLVNNLLAAVNLSGAAEALALAQQLGLDPAATLAVIEQSSGQSWIGSDRLRRALCDDPAVHAHVALLAKDSALALEAARQVGFVPQVGLAAGACFAGAVADGLARRDDSALWHWLACAPRAPRAPD